MHHVLPYFALYHRSDQYSNVFFVPPAHLMHLLTPGSLFFHNTVHVLCLLRNRPYTAASRLKRVQHALSGRADRVKAIALSASISQVIVS
ncbi:MAG: hypothetical protein LBJ41_04790 [Treponema sp.]|nr:hypothetical protein [Treponema sp.]